MHAIDRQALVQRHTVAVDGVHPHSPLSVGNGELCFTVDPTGLQTFPDAYPLPEREGGEPGTLLGTQSHWGWHAMPGGEQHDLASTRRGYDTPRGRVPYVDMGGRISGTDESGADATEAWLRANPHRLDLARVGLTLLAPDGAPHAPDVGDLDHVEQRLDLWDGVLRSRFRLAGDDVQVVTACHPELDVLAIRVTSVGVAAGRIGVTIAFPYGSESWNVAADWSRDDAHTTTVVDVGDGWRFDRVLDDTRLHVRLAADGATLQTIGPHASVVHGATDTLDLRLVFAPGRAELTADPDSTAARLPSVDDTVAASADHWAAFWQRGAAVELADSDDPRALELERRIVLSQFVTALHSAGSLPPQETGLMCNSWRGRFHLEMHWWHGVHLPLWGRADLLERSMGFYEDVLDRARETAAIQGLPGVRWPKQVGPDGRESPSPIGTFLLWQQPHPIYLAELLRRVCGDHVVDRYGDLVLETAAFMAALPVLTERGYELAPPLVPAQESYADDRARMSNPTFELAYWVWGLEVAAEWRARLGLDPEPAWDAVAAGLVRPHVRDGVYTAVDVEPYTIREDHPSMAYAMGMVPPTHLIDPETLRRTLHDVRDDWDWSSTWGWDYPALAMTAARLGEPDLALDLLLLPLPKNEYLPNGHNRQTDTLPIYLPGNGGLLTAIAMMVGGWDGDGGRPTPGLPDDGTWTVRHEGLHPLP